MAAQKTLTIRPRNDVVDDWDDIENFCKKMDLPMSAIFNAYIPAIAQAINHQLYRDESTGQLFARSDFGDILIK